MSMETQGRTENTSPEDYLPPGTEVLETVNEEGLDIHVLRSEGYVDGERALLVVHDTMRPCVYAGENPLQLAIENGFGNLHIVDLESGALNNAFLESGKQIDVPPGVVYWYENIGTVEDGPLVILDTCIGFNPEHEPTLEDLVTGLKNLLAG